MSLVTNCILSFSILDDTEERMKEVNSFFDCKPLVSCDESLCRGWYGGTKMLETPIYIGAFNYLPRYDFLNHISTIDWEYPEDVQLLLQEQDYNCFAVFRIPSPHDRSKFQVTAQHIALAQKHGHIYSQDCNPIILAIREVYPDSLWFGQTLLIKKPGKYGKRSEFYYISNELTALPRSWCKASEIEASDKKWFKEAKVPITMPQWLKDAKPFEFEITGLYADRML